MADFIELTKFHLPLVGAASAVRAARRAALAKDWAAAAHHYALALKAAPRRAQIWVQYGHALKEQGARAAAEKAYLQALDLAPETADTHVQLGHLAKLMGAYGDAEQYYRRALELQPSRRDATHELDALLARAGGAARTALLKSPSRRQTTAATFVAGEGCCIAFDVSDLVDYFAHARHPTGIQRLQIEGVMAANRHAGTRAIVCCYAADDGVWRPAPAAEFDRLCQLALAPGSLDASDWLAARSAFTAALGRQAPVRFPIGAYLVNLGSCWSLPNYFLRLRAVINHGGLVYVPFVHDLIPIFAPENCVTELVQDFVGWVLGVFDHAQFFLANSEATKADLLQVAAMLGREPLPVQVIRLDADSRKDEPVSVTADAQVRAELGLGSDPYVLFVSTVQPRKNHLLVLSAWLHLLRTRGSDRVPNLVCVGSAGWMNEAVFGRLNASEALQSKVTMLTGLSDGELAVLYRGSLFTVYPSLYEGWGLPVTESLCHGRTALVARTSSLPEAGGDLVDYFDPRSEAEFCTRLERLIDDDAYRAARERRIADEFRPRAWSSIAAEIVSVLTVRHAARAAERPHRVVGRAELGKLYLVTRNDETAIWPGMVSGEILREGEGWWAPEDWGCWIKPGGAALAMSIDASDEPLRAYLGLRGLPSQASRYTIEGTGETLAGTIGARASRWVPFILPPRPTASELRLTLSSDATEDLSMNFQDGDRRVVALGVIGIMICRESDVRSRVNMLEAIQFGDLTLARQQAGSSGGAASLALAGTAPLA